MKKQLLTLKRPDAEKSKHKVNAKENVFGRTYVIEEQVFAPAMIFFLISLTSGETELEENNQV